MDDLHKAIAKIIAAAWTDTTDSFQKELQEADDAREFLRKKDLELPDFPDFHKDGKIRFVANTDYVRYIVIPERPKFTDEDMGLIIKLRQHCAPDCSCTTTSLGSLQHIVEAAKKILEGG